MHAGDSSNVQAGPARSRLGRWLLATAGVISVGLAALGVLLPGLPTTIFLIAACWCFARSCPWLEDRLVRTPLFRPFLRYLDGGRMPLRAVVITLAVMWTAIGVSTTVLVAGGEPRPVIAAVVLAAGLVGSVFVVRLREKEIGLSPRRGPRDTLRDWPNRETAPVKAEEA